MWRVPSEVEALRLVGVSVTLTWFLVVDALFTHARCLAVLAAQDPQRDKSGFATTGHDPRTVLPLKSEQPHASASARVPEEPRRGGSEADWGRDARIRAPFRPSTTPCR